VLARARQVDPECFIGGLRAGDRLKHQINRRRFTNQVERGGDMR